MGSNSMINELEHRRLELQKELERVNGLIEQRKELVKPVFAGHPSQSVHRKIRTVAKALLDLYELLGEVPKQRNYLIVLAEREE